MFTISRKYRLERRAARAFALKNYAGAADALNDLLEVVGENPNTLRVLAVCHLRRGEHDSAIAAAGRGLAADPDHLDCLKVLAEAHVALDQREPAREFAARALALIEAPRSAPGLFRRVLRPDPRAGGGARLTAGERAWADWARNLRDTPEGVGSGG